MIEYHIANIAQAGYVAKQEALRNNKSFKSSLVATINAAK